MNFEMPPIPAFLYRGPCNPIRYAETAARCRAEIEGKRIWIMPGTGPRPKIRPQLFLDNPGQTVQVNVEHKGSTPTRLQEYPNAAEFFRLHDFDDYPVRRHASTGGVTTVLCSAQVWVNRPGSAPRKPGDPTPSRRAGTRDRIWELADKFWTEAGKPTDVKKVLELRKQWMTRMETEDEIKKTTSSSELGQWMKDRIPVVS